MWKRKRSHKAAPLHKYSFWQKSRIQFMKISLGGLPAVLRLTESTKGFFTRRFCGTESIDPLLSKKETDQRYLQRSMEDIKVHSVDSRLNCFD